MKICICCVINVLFRIIYFVLIMKNKSQISKLIHFLIQEYSWELIDLNKIKEAYLDYFQYEFAYIFILANKDNKNCIKCFISLYHKK